MTEKQIKNLEASLRGKARRRGYLLRKCRSRNPEVPSYGTYGLADFNNVMVLGDNQGYGEDLEQIAEFLRG